MAKVKSAFEQHRDGTLLRRQRIEMGLSLRDVALRLGIAKNTLARIERGLHQPKVGTARSIYMFYEGKVPIWAIYDPCFIEYLSDMADELGVPLADSLLPKQ